VDGWSASTGGGLRADGPITFLVAAEALATLGYTDTLAAWERHNVSIRRYEARLEPR
jgi:hypothetical protein